ncbi:MAG: hypothetical protein NT154_22415 [Verrucomicrobia bacterium]|nr:hypothetical protein [Verrucomicrobiota bacterium]
MRGPLLRRLRVELPRHSVKTACVARMATAPVRGRSRVGVLGFSRADAVWRRGQILRSSLALTMRAFSTPRQRLGPVQVYALKGFNLTHG